MCVRVMYVVVCLSCVFARSINEISQTKKKVVYKKSREKACARPCLEVCNMVMCD